jgi:hypothetical protein
MGFTRETRSVSEGPRMNSRETWTSGKTGVPRRLFELQTITDREASGGKTLAAGRGLVTQTTVKPRTTRPESIGNAKRSTPSDCRLPLHPATRHPATRKFSESAGFAGQVRPRDRLRSTPKEQNRPAAPEGAAGPDSRESIITACKTRLYRFANSWRTS